MYEQPSAGLRVVRAEHEVVDEQLRAPVEQLGQGLRPLVRLEVVLLLDRHPGSSCRCRASSSLRRVSSFSRSSSSTRAASHSSRVPTVWLRHRARLPSPQSESVREAEVPEGCGEGHGVVRPARAYGATDARGWHPPALDARDEGGDVADLLAAKGQHVERERQVALLLRVPGVEGERRLPVCANANGTPAPLARQRPAGQEDPRSPRDRRTRSPSGGIANVASSASIATTVVDVAPLPRVHVALHDLAQPLVAERAQGGLLALLGKPLVDRLAGALQGAVHRGDGRLERLGDLAGREAEHLAQDQHGALVGRQVLERRDERQLDALALLVARLGRGKAVLEAQPSRPGTAPPTPTRRSARRGPSWGSAAGP